MHPARARERGTEGSAGCSHGPNHSDAGSRPLHQTADTGRRGAVSAKKTSVKVEILGESYVLRTEAAPEHTKAVAEHLDKAIRQILSSGAVIEANRAAILAALQITSELFQAREAN